MATNLNEYYTGQGKKLPTVQERQGIASGAGISGYTGTAAQNTTLLNYLQTPKSSTPNMSAAGPEQLQAIKTTPTQGPLLLKQNVINSIQTIKDKFSQTPNMSVQPAKTFENSGVPYAPSAQQGASTPTPTVQSAAQTAVSAQPTTPTQLGQATTIQAQPVVQTNDSVVPSAPKTTEPVKTKAQTISERRVARVTQSNLSKYRTGAELYNAVQGGLIKEGTREYDALAQANPDLITQYKTHQQDVTKKETINNLGNVVVGAEVAQKPTKTSDKFFEYFAQGLDDDLAANYARDVTNNPDYLKAVKTLEGINTQIVENNKNINKIHTDVRASLSGDTPESLVASRIAREAKPLIENGMYLAELAQNAESSMNRIFDGNKDAFEIQMEDRNQKRNLAFQLYGTTRAEEIRQEDLIRADKELADQLARVDKADSEEVKRLKEAQIDNLRLALAQMGVDPEGSTYDELLGELATAVKSQTKEAKTITGLRSGDYYLDNGVLKQVPAGGSTNTAPAPSRKPTISSSYTPEGTFKVDIANGAAPRKSDRGFYECGMLVNDTLGIAMADLHEDKLKYVNSDQPIVGGAFVEKTSDKYGHTGIVESINADGTINIVETNYPLGAGVSRKTIDPSKRNIVGYYDPQAAQQSGYRDITDIVMPEKTTEFKAKSLTFGQRMDDADRLIQSAEERFKLSGTTGEYLTPRGEWTPNFLKSSDQQQFEQARRNFINAVLRRESGAVISDREFANARQQYFPQPGDTTETIDQKRRNREVVTTGMFRDAGKTESGEDIGGIYRGIKSKRTHSQKTITTEETYTPKEEEMIRELLAAGATEEEIDQAIISLRK